MQESMSSVDVKTDLAFLDFNQSIHVSALPKYLRGVYIVCCASLLDISDEATSRMTFGTDFCAASPGFQARHAPATRLTG